MDQTWFDKVETQGFKRGEARGKAEAVNRMRRLVLKAIEERFGSVPEPVQTRVQATTSIETLARLFAKIPSLRSAEGLLPRRNGKAQSAA